MCDKDVCSYQKYLDLVVTVFAFYRRYPVYTACLLPWLWLVKEGALVQEIRRLSEGRGIRQWPNWSNELHHWYFCQQGLGQLQKWNFSPHSKEMLNLLPRCSLAKAVHTWEGKRNNAILVPCSSSKSLELSLPRPGSHSQGWGLGCFCGKTRCLFQLKVLVKCRVDLDSNWVSAHYHTHISIHHYSVRALTK
jgi:hypothetical protein